MLKSCLLEKQEDTIKYLEKYFVKEKIKDALFINPYEKNVYDYSIIKYISEKEIIKKLIGIRRYTTCYYGDEKSLEGIDSNFSEEEKANAKQEMYKIIKLRLDLRIKNINELTRKGKVSLPGVGCKLLDCCSGDCYIGTRIADKFGYDYYAYEINVYNVDYSQGKRIYVNNNRLPYNNAEFDVILMFHSLHKINSLLFNETLTKAKKGCVLIMREHDVNSEYSNKIACIESILHEICFNRNSYDNAVKSFGSYLNKYNWEKNLSLHGFERKHEIIVNPKTKCGAYIYIKY